MREPVFGASSVRFRCGPPVCSPPELTGPAGLYLPASLPGLLLPGFQVTRSPHMPAGYGYNAKLRIASAGLSPASTAASLAAPVRRVFPGTASSTGTSQFGAEPSAGPSGLRLTPPCPQASPAFAPSAERVRCQAACPPVCAVRWLQRGHRCPEVLAPAGSCCPTLLRLATASASVEISASFPGSAGFRRGLRHS